MKTPAENYTLKVCPASCGSRYLEVFKGNALIVTAYASAHQTEAEAVADLAEEFVNPFGATWDDAEQFGRELQAVKWLASYYSIKWPA